MARVLVVDDEAEIVRALTRSLSRLGHEVAAADTAHDGLIAVATSRPQVVVLDLRLPDLDGIEVVRRLRSWTSVPVVFLSGEGAERVRIRALDAGADDFVRKPFSVDELRARIEAVLRRGQRGDDAPDRAALVELGDLRIDLVEHEVAVAGTRVRLTPTEWRLLRLLIENEGRLLTYRQIITEIWSERHGKETRATLRAHMRTLRRKLRDDATEPRYIATEPGIGYRWKAADPAG